MQKSYRKPDSWSDSSPTTSYPQEKLTWSSNSVPGSGWNWIWNIGYLFLWNEKMKKKCMNSKWIISKVSRIAYIMLLKQGSVESNQTLTSKSMNQQATRDKAALCRVLWKKAKKLQLNARNINNQLKDTYGSWIERIALVDVAEIVNDVMKISDLIAENLEVKKKPLCVISWSYFFCFVDRSFSVHRISISTDHRTLMLCWARLHFLKSFCN